MSRRISTGDEHRLRKVYKRWHWGEPATHIVEADPDLPPHLVEIGLLMELHFVVLPGRKPVILAVEDGDINNNHVAFDADHKNQRIYLQLSESSKKSAKQLWDRNGVTYPLASVAKAVGSKHAKGGYPVIEVQPLGKLTNIVYYTHKRGDGPSGYIHEMGEEGGVPPVLCLSHDGRLWLAGGSYTCPSPGITN